jgi:hypothetical protein
MAQKVAFFAPSGDHAGCPARPASPCSATNGWPCRASSDHVSRAQQPFRCSGSGLAAQMDPVRHTTYASNCVGRQRQLARAPGVARDADHARRDPGTPAATQRALRDLDDHAASVRVGSVREAIAAAAGTAAGTAGDSCCWHCWHTSGGGGAAEQQPQGEHHRHSRHRLLLCCQSLCRSWFQAVVTHGRNRSVVAQPSVPARATPF